MATEGFIFKTEIIVGNLILPSTRPTRPPRNPIAIPIIDSISNVLFLLMDSSLVSDSILIWDFPLIRTTDSKDTIIPIKLSNKATGTYVVKSEPQKAPTAPVIAIIKKILVFTFFCLRCRTAAGMAAIVLIPILVPAATPIEVSAPMISGNRKTPSIKPTIPPTKPIAKPITPRIGTNKLNSITRMIKSPL